MNTRLSYITDTIGNNYIGVNIYPEMVATYLEKLKNILNDEYEEYINIQKNRDHGKYHITVINVMEYNRLCKEVGIDKFVNSLEHIFSMEFNVNLIGLGTAEKNGNRAYFVVVKSEELQEVRKKYGLSEQDFHITIAMKWKDVFGVRKNQVLPEVDPFLKLLKNEYYKKNETFDFVKTLTNFDGNQNDDVEPIKIEDNYATFRIGKNRYYTVSLIGDNLMISAKWEDSSDKQILSNTLIYRKLKK